ncbi:MAG TPA: hypothetical protein VJH68_04805 [Candidatus Nanoarchaeia archaeon]|nr:hypothetical protein [Candidatus Nanoarchaeia archaeon]
MKYFVIKGLVVGSFLAELAACVTPNNYNDSLDRFLSTRPAQDYKQQKVLGDVHKVMMYGETPLAIKGPSGISEAYQQQRLKTVNLEEVVLPETSRSVTIEGSPIRQLNDLEEQEITDYTGTVIAGEGITLTVEEGFGSPPADESD